MGLFHFFGGKFNHDPSEDTRGPFLQIDLLIRSSASFLIPLSIDSLTGRIGHLRCPARVAESASPFPVASTGLAPFCDVFPFQEFEGASDGLPAVGNMSKADGCVILGDPPNSSPNSLLRGVLNSFKVTRLLPSPSLDAWHGSLGGRVHLSPFVSLHLSPVVSQPGCLRVHFVFLCLPSFVSRCLPAWMPGTARTGSFVSLCLPSFVSRCLPA